MNKRAIGRFGIILLILAIGSFFRFYEITSTPPGLYPDEAMNGTNALSAIDNDIGIYDFKVFYPENNGREGLFINIQALAVKELGNKPWVLRIVSAFFGTLTILGVYFLSKEFFGKRIAWIASFIIATSYWHINFSRIGFRAIMVPFFSVFALYFIFRGLRRGKILDIALSGLAVGLGLQTYTAFRFFPFVMLIPLLAYLWKWKKNKLETKHCVPCAVLLFLIVSFAVFAPLGIYYIQHPADFVGRGEQVSIFSAVSPAKEFIKSNFLTLGMVFVRGDCNWRHNLACQPELNPIVSIFFIAGVILAIKNLYKKRPELKLVFATIIGWLVFLSLPATLTREGMPHALRSIGLIPPIMILAGFGADWLLEKSISWFKKQEKTKPEAKKQLERIQKEVIWLFVVLLMIIPYVTYRDYFIRWARNPNTYFAFSTDFVHIGDFLNSLPKDMTKYVIVNVPGTEVEGLPVAAQTVKFVNNKDRNTIYLLSENIDDIKMPANKKMAVTFLNGLDRNLVGSVQKKFPKLRLQVPGDFMVLKSF